MSTSTGPLGIRITPLLKRVVGVLFACYVGQLIAVSWAGLPVSDWLFLNPFRSGNWRPWQPLTSLLFNSTPLNALLSWLGLAWFLPAAVDSLGTKRLVRIMAISVLGAMAVTVGLDIAGLLVGDYAYVGLSPVLMALLVIFGLSNPEGTIHLMMVLPIKAKWLAWAAGAFGLLNFLMSRNLPASLYLFSWIGAYVGMLYGEDYLKQLKLRRRARETEKELSKFRVIKGGKDDDGDDWIN